MECFDARLIVDPECCCKSDTTAAASSNPKTSKVRNGMQYCIAVARYGGFVIKINNNSVGWLNEHCSDISNQFLALVVRSQVYPGR
jgi:hypothetical protein